MHHPAILLTSLAHFAAAGGPGISQITGQIDTLLATIKTWLLTLGTTLGVIYVAIGGARYIMSGSNGRSMEGAQTTIKHALVGALIIAAAVTLISVAQGLVK